MALALITAACGGASRDGAIDELVEQGITDSSANCVMDEVEAAGFTADDVADPITPAVEPVVADAMNSCMTDADLPGLLGFETIEEVQGNLAEQMAATGAMTAEEATCVIKDVADAGFPLLAVAGLGDPTLDSGVADAIANAGLACISS